MYFHNILNWDQFFKNLRSELRLELEIGLHDFTQIKIHKLLIILIVTESSKNFCSNYEKFELMTFKIFEP